MAGLGVSFAGVAGLTATFAPEEERDSAVWWWRITTVVRTGLGLTFLGFGIIATEVVIDVVTLTVRIASDPHTPRGLTKVTYMEEPGGVDVGFARNEEQLDLKSLRFASAGADIASALRGLPKDELASEELGQHHRTGRMAWAAGMGLLVLAVAAFGVGAQSVTNAAEAERQAQRAREKEEEAEAQRLQQPGGGRGTGAG